MFSKRVNISWCTCFNANDIFKKLGQQFLTLHKIFKQCISISISIFIFWNIENINKRRKNLKQMNDRKEEQEATSQATTLIGPSHLPDHCTWARVTARSKGHIDASKQKMLHPQLLIPDKFRSSFNLKQCLTSVVHMVIFSLIYHISSFS